MGAGIANPESISKDVIFPNYNWPKLAGVQEKWNVTTFVVLGHEMIKAMKVGRFNSIQSRSHKNFKIRARDSEKT